MSLHAGADERMRFDGKTIVVTGTNSGVGAATAALLGTRGARVIGLDARGDGASLHGFHNFELTDPASIDAPQPMGDARRITNPRKIGNRVWTCLNI